MLVSRLLMLFALYSFFISSAAWAAQEAPSAKAASASVLFVLTAESGQMTKSDSGYQLILRKVSPHTLWFTDRPDRKTGLLTTSKFLNLWQKEFGNSDPNVAVTHERLKKTAAELLEAQAMEISKPVLLKDKSLKFTVHQLPNSQLHLGQLKNISLFIDSASYALLTSSTAVTSDTEQLGRFRVTNQCQQTLWIQQDFKHPTRDPVVVQVKPGMAYDYNIPDEGLASTRFWAKSGCNEHGYQCEIGETTSVPEAEKAGWQKPPYAPDINSKFEATWGCVNTIFNHSPKLCASNPSDPGQHVNNETWWNGSAVDGYTLPYAVNVYNHQNSCLDLHSSKVLTDPGVNCGGLSASFCPSQANLSTEGKFNVINGVDVSQVNLQWLNPKTQQPIGCFSPCAKLTTAQGSDGGSKAGGWRNVLGGLSPESPQAQMYCCPTPPISSGQCSAGPAARSAYSKSIANQLCNAYTYAYDDAKGLAKCGAQTQFELVFCPGKAKPQQFVDMTISLVDGALASFNNQTVTNGQTIRVADGSLLASGSLVCEFRVEKSSVVSTTEGALCANVAINNAQKQITLSKPTPAVSNLQLQVNFNTAFGITAMLNQRQLQNAEVVNAADFGSVIKLTAHQAHKSASCQLNRQDKTVSAGSGELCHRLNIVKDGQKIHIYLPADIPEMSKVPPAVALVEFAMDTSIYVKLAHHTLTNGSQLSLDVLKGVSPLTLTAHQHHHSASCNLAINHNQLSIVANSGTLCSAGLSVLKKEDGNYFIGLPSRLPEPDTNGSGMEIKLGIAHGMKVMIGDKTIDWSSPDPRATLKQGEQTIKIHGNNGTIRQCRVTVNNNQLLVGQSAGCVGVVAHPGIIYFPYF